MIHTQEALLQLISCSIILCEKNSLGPKGSTVPPPTHEIHLYSHSTWKKLNLISLDGYVFLSTFWKLWMAALVYVAVNES